MGQLYKTAIFSPFLTDINGLWFMGQSLGEGSESLPVVTPTDTGWGNYAFKRGVRTWAQGDHSTDPEGRSKSDFTFVSLTAAANGGLGETIANGVADHLKAAFVRSTTAPARPAPPHFLVAYAGQGGRTIEELSIADESTDPRTPTVKQGGGGFYKTSLDDARRAAQQAKAQRQDFFIAALLWMQGEANGGPTGGIVPSRWKSEIPPPEGQHWYRDRLLAYRKQWSTDLIAITEQKGEIPMFTYQTLGPAADAQLMAADTDPFLYLVGPHYAVASALNSRTTLGRYGAAIHLSADGQRWLGEQFAKVIRRALAEREDWQPLRPRKAWIDASRTSVLVDFAVPRPPLVIDDEFLPLQQSALGKEFSTLCGFRVRNPAGAVPPMTAVEVESPTSVRIKLASPLSQGVGYTLSYGSPFAGVLGLISTIRPGPMSADQATTELLVKDIAATRLKLLVDEGAFYVMNTEPGAALAQATIRHTHEESGFTVLRFENRELRNSVPFAAGQTLSALRPFSYGNVRDSDSEPAIYPFADATYGNRAGRPYPLWNWCVLFNDLAIAEAP
ncbi:MAG: phosphate ABC transporter substrate-binding protein [Prosthecobacter sp.]|nr:phosphate ABC transporter substrate-binding protein [Prosthecobacter sp.]